MGLFTRLRSVRGFLLPLTLLAATALFLFGLSFLKFVNAEALAARHLVFSVSARQAALAGRTEAFAKLSKDSSWKGSLKWTKFESAGSEYSLTFSPGAGNPYSTSNVGSTQPVKGWNGTTVPPGFVHLVALGRCGPVTQRSEALLSPPGGIILEDHFESGFSKWTNLVGPPASGSGLLSVGGGASQTATSGTTPTVTTVTTVNHPGNSNPSGHAYGHTATQTVVVTGSPATGPVASSDQLLIHQQARARQFEAQFRARPESEGGPASFYFRATEENGHIVEGLRLVLDPTGDSIRVERIEGDRITVLKSTTANLDAPAGGTGSGGTTTTTTTTTRVDPGHSDPSGHAYGHLRGTETVTVQGGSGSSGTVPFSEYKVTVSNGKITIVRDGIELFSVTDPTSQRSGGERFGFGAAKNSGLEIDDLIIKNLETRLVSAWTAASSTGPKK